MACTGQALLQLRRTQLGASNQLPCPASSTARQPATPAQPRAQACSLTQWHVSMRLPSPSIAHRLCTSSDSWNLCSRSGLRPRPRGSKPKLLRRAEPELCVYLCCRASLHLHTLAGPPGRMACQCLVPSSQPWRRSWCCIESAHRRAWLSLIGSTGGTSATAHPTSAPCRRAGWASSSVLQSAPGAESASCWLALRARCRPARADQTQGEGQIGSRPSMACCFACCT